MVIRYKSATKKVKSFKTKNIRVTSARAKYRREKKKSHKKTDPYYKKKETKLTNVKEVERYNEVSRGKKPKKNIYFRQGNDMIRVGFFFKGKGWIFGQSNRGLSKQEAIEEARQNAYSRVDYEYSGGYDSTEGKTLVKEKAKKYREGVIRYVEL